MTILASRDAHGFLSFRDVTVYTKESGSDESGVLFAMVTVERTGRFIRFKTDVHYFFFIDYERRSIAYS